MCGCARMIDFVFWLECLRVEGSEWNERGNKERGDCLSLVVYRGTVYKCTSGSILFSL